jgi:hypothetical protein
MRLSTPAGLASASPAMEVWGSWSDSAAWGESEAASSWASRGAAWAASEAGSSGASDAAWCESEAASSSRHDVRGWGAGERRKEKRHEQAAVRRAETTCRELSSDKWAKHREVQATYESEMMQYEAESAQLRTELTAMAREHEEAQQIAPALQQTEMWLQQARKALDKQKQETAASHLQTVDAVNELIQIRIEVQAAMVERQRHDELIANSETAVHTLKEEIAELKLANVAQLRTVRCKVAEALEERAAVQREVDRLTATVRDPRLDAAFADSRGAKRRQE